MTRIKNQHTYSLKNCQGGTAVDHYDGDAVYGYSSHEGSYQKWIFQQDGDQDGWFIKSFGSGKYLGIEGNPKNGTPVVVVSNPFKWDVKASDIKSAKGIRISVHGTRFSLDLSNGNSANSTKIQLWGSWPGANQIWAFTERISIEDQHSYSLKNCQRGTAVNISGDDNYSSKYYPCFKNISSQR
ncbi:ricin B lectin domain-containing protein [Suillus spraguei]|nr:ricin B lectin domain-containing protein [Suillus spraguei]